MSNTPTLLISILLACNFALGQNRPLAELRIQTVRGGIAFLSGAFESGQTADFLLDTGGSGNLVDRETAVKFGMRMLRGAASVSGTANLDVGVIPQALLTIGPLQHRSQLLATDLSGLGPALGRPVTAILGGEFLRKYAVELDYERKLIRLYEPARFQYQGEGVAAPLTMMQGIPFITLTVTLPNGKRVQGRFLLDTGGAMTIHIYRQIAAREGLLDGLPVLPESGLGIGGTTRRSAARGAGLVIGPFEMPHPVVAFTDDAAGLRTDPQSAGLIGMEVLSRFDVTLDYSRERIYLKPNRRFGEPFIYDASGLGLRAPGPSYSQAVVSSVREASPAQSAGIRPGDVLVQIDGESASGLSLDAIREKLKWPDQSHRLSLTRGERTMEVVIRTRDLLE
jgi:hypothetical protein